MSLSATVLGGLIDANLAGDGAIGPNRTSFSYAVARGIVNHFVGKNFQTSDSGNGLGGTGSGIGILALNSSNMATIAYNSMTSHGPKANSFWNAIMSAVVTHLQGATQLTTTNPDVGVGTGIVIVGSFTVNVPGLQASIDAELVGDGANGYNRPNFSYACANGIVTDVLAAGTGTVTISGPAIPPGTSGTGFGTIS